MWTKSLSELNIQPEDHFYPWLCEVYALGAAMKTLCQNLSVQVLSQEIAAANTDEQQLLNIQENNSWIRQVNLVADGVAWSAGRVIVPHTTYEKYKHDFDSLGSKLLGEAMLYNKPHVSRSAFEYKKLDNKLWARRSVFNIAGDRLMVMDAFYPQIPAYRPGSGRTTIA